MAENVGNYNNDVKLKPAPSAADTLDPQLRSEQQHFHFKSSSHQHLHARGHRVWPAVNHYPLQEANVAAILMLEICHVWFCDKWKRGDPTRAQTPACPFNECLISPKLIFPDEDAGYTCRSAAAHKALILKGLVGRCCSVQPDAFCRSHIINLRSLFLAAFFLSFGHRPLFSPVQMLTFQKIAELID